MAGRAGRVLALHAGRILEARSINPLRRPRESLHPASICSGLQHPALPPYQPPGPCVSRPLEQPPTIFLVTPAVPVSAEITCSIPVWMGGNPFLCRAFSVSEHLSDDAVRAEVDTINEKFAEARDEIEMALESKDTVYFNEEAETARKAVNEVLESFTRLLNQLDEERRGALQRSMGLKMEQLKGELEQLNHDHE